MTAGHTQAAPGQRFTGMTLDRADTARKDPRWVTEMAARPGARPPGRGPGTALRRAGERRDPILLGLEQGAPRFAIDLDDLPDPTSGGPAGDSAADAGVVGD